jgi:molybdopterin-guanine dinucleotide biosynthesis protein A
MKDALDRFNAEKVIIENSDWYANLNTPEEYHAFIHEAKEHDNGVVR